MQDSPLGPVEVHDLHSQMVGDTFRIFAASAGGDPERTLVLTDANGQFGMALDVIRLMQLTALVPSLLVVGIGYPGAQSLADTVRIRARDLTPTPMPMFEASGGADAFADFVDVELRPWLEAMHPRAAADITYFGASLGGLFGTHLALHRPTMFDRYILGSPSLWWDGGWMFDAEARLAETGVELAADLYFAIGSLETDEGRRLEGVNLPDGHPMKPRDGFHLDMVDDLRRFVAQLEGRGHRGLCVALEVISDEFHVTVGPSVLSRGLRHFALGASG